MPKQANATTPLSVAVIQNLRNLVQLMPHKNSKRAARKSDSMSPGDKLSTGRSALADLRFNDGSLARIGEQAVFQFLPQRRNFNLDHGTVLLLIPPGRGQTRISTPNAAAAIRGSALFVRYDQETDTTIVGALTNSGIQVSNKDASQKRELQAGQLIVLVKGELKGLYDFDLRTFYETSTLVRDLNLTLRNGIPNSDPAIASVQAETAAAVAAQSPVAGQDVVENPPFVKPTTSPNLPSNNITRDNSPVPGIIDNQDLVSNPVSSSTPKPRSIPTDSGTPPTNEPTTTTSPIVTPSGPVTPVPVTQPTITAPPVTQPSVPVTQPTITVPPVTQPSVPVTQPTITVP
ncbi:FecR domain-containing protein, partial [Brasilonema bromeliae]